MMLKASLQESSQTHDFALGQGNSTSATSQSIWIYDFFFRRYTQWLRRFRRSGAGASCVAFLVILGILKILLVHSLKVLWFWATFERFGCMMHDASKTNMVILCKTLWSLSHENHIHFIQEMQKNNRWIWRASEGLGLTGLTVPIVWTKWKFTCPTKTPLGVSVTDVTVRVTSHPQLSQLRPQPQSKRPRRMCTNGTLFTWFALDASIELSS